VAWESRWQAFFSSLRAVFSGPKVPKSWPTSRYFRDTWVRPSFPTRALIASVLWHIVFIRFPFPMWIASNARPQWQASRIEVTWYGPVRDLPPLTAPAPLARPSPTGEPNKPPPPRGADAFHPRQTIISAPLRPTHPRQTLIQPNVPPEPPKILAALPNIVQWPQAPQLAKPQLSISGLTLARLRPKKLFTAPPVPAMPNLELQAGELNIAPSAISKAQPQLPMAPMAVPQAGPQHPMPDAAPTPDIGASVAAGNIGDNGLQRLIALSASPAPPAPVISVPSGNLAARLTISPEGSQPGSPGGSPNGPPGETGGTLSSVGGNGSAISGPPGITITGGNLNSASPISSNAGVRSGSGMMAIPLPPKPEPRPAPPDPVASRPTAALGPLKPGAQPENILGPKAIYTLHVNMPNLASATGSWILRFAELPQEDAPNPPPANPGELVGPVPLRKVDPKYPPALASAHVEGEVVLYAIIRKDGSVDSIQLVKGLDPQLDQNAMEALARWKFRPANRHGMPVELEAVIHIPFRATAPF